MPGPRVAINGFGRMGRLITRALLEHDAPVDLVAINDLADPQLLAHIFQHDSVHGPFPGEVRVQEDVLVFAGDPLRALRESDPSRLPWKELGVDYVVDATGRFRTRETLGKHLHAGARRAILTAPGKDALDATLVMGVNADRYDPTKHRLVSNASCTTNCLAPVLLVLDDAFGVAHASMTTVHAYTNSQPLLDSAHKDPRRARAGALNMVPTSTGAAKAIGEVLPRLAGKVDGMAIRVPVPNVSLVDLTARLGKDASRDEVVDAFEAAAAGRLAGILRCEARPLVSTDFNHDPYSAVVDLPALTVVDKRLVKVLAWYDNEWAYACRTADLVHHMWQREP